MLRMPSDDCQAGKAQVKHGGLLLFDPERAIKESFQLHHPYFIAI